MQLSRNFAEISKKVQKSLITRIKNPLKINKNLPNLFFENLENQESPKQFFRDLYKMVSQKVVTPVETEPRVFISTQKDWIPAFAGDDENATERTFYEAIP
jgi:phage-related minor tail protein